MNHSETECHSHRAVGLAEKAIKESAFRCLPQSQLILFGSRASGKEGRRSDFDLAVRRSPADSYQDVINFKDALDSSPDLIYPVDVIDYDSAPEALKKRINKEGRIWKK